MEWLKLIGILVVVVGFVLKFDTMATVVVAGLVTGLVAGMSPMEILETLAKHYPGVRGGFMHVPFIPSQTVNRPSPAPSMAQTDIARGIEAAIAAIAENDADIAAAEGQTH